jgi:hypothetical protein
MTEMAARRRVGGMPGCVAARIARLQRQWSDCLHADGDAFAREHGWIITTSTGRLGFGARVYRDPRFGQSAVATRRDQEYTGWRTDARSG